jgi:hypothetical protein
VGVPGAARLSSAGIALKNSLLRRGCQTLAPAPRRAGRPVHFSTDRPRKMNGINSLDGDKTRDGCHRSLFNGPWGQCSASLCVPCLSQQELARLVAWVTLSAAQRRSAIEMTM